MRAQGLTRTPVLGYAANHVGVRTNATCFVVGEANSNKFENAFALDFFEIAHDLRKGRDVHHDRSWVPAPSYDDWPASKIADNLRSVTVKIRECDLLSHKFRDRLCVEILLSIEEQNHRSNEGRRRLWTTR